MHVKAKADLMDPRLPHPSTPLPRLRTPTSETAKRYAAPECDTLNSEKRRKVDICLPELYTVNNGNGRPELSFDDSANETAAIINTEFGAAPKPKNLRAEPAPRKNTQKRELVNVKDKQTNEIVEEKDADLNKQLDHVIKSFRNVFKERKLRRLNYYEFVTDPHDFGATIQNCFCIAFLLKDMRLYLEKKEDDEFPYLRKLSKDEKTSADQVIDGGKPFQTNQTINTITYSKWQGIVHDLNLTEALIKPKKNQPFVNQPNRQQRHVLPLSFMTPPTSMQRLPSFPELDSPSYAQFFARNEEWCTTITQKDGPEFVVRDAVTRLENKIEIHISQPSNLRLHNWITDKGYSVESLPPHKLLFYGKLDECVRVEALILHFYFEGKLDLQLFNLRKEHKQLLIEEEYIKFGEEVEILLQGFALEESKPGYGSLLNAIKYIVENGDVKGL
uniref:Non-structural maintenance of chromosomes element 4 n=1 Tax=Panagrolaimus davidi TaxID=227884 RepID=A0A914QVG2_9BILA